MAGTLSYVNTNTPQQAVVECDNCRWSGTSGDLEPISDLANRIEAGEIVPAGECPDCGCFAHLVPPFKWTIEIEVDPIWVADGFDLSDDTRTLDWLQNDLTGAAQSELGARVIKSPNQDAIDRVQGA